jgi:hypothetical protein
LISNEIRRHGVEDEYNGITVLQRAADGYRNASAMCRANGKSWSHYRENKATEELVEELS